MSHAGLTSSPAKADCQRQPALCSIALLDGKLDALKKELEEREKPQTAPEKPTDRFFQAIANRPREIVAGGDVRWKPVDKQAAMMLAKAPWWAHPPIVETPEPKQPKPKKKKARTHMNELTSGPAMLPGQIPTNGTYTSDTGMKIKMVNGEAFFSLDDIQRVLIEEIGKLPKETRPAVKAAEDARAVMDSLLQGIGQEMEKFRSDTKHYLEDIRQTRFAVVRETAEMTGPLKEVRQFFLGGEYKEEIARLREFVDLCERLDKLKQSGFLDKVADTMLGLAV